MRKTEKAADVYLISRPAGGRARTIHSVLRAFALEQLAAGETADILKRHALAMRNFLQRVGPSFGCSKTRALIRTDIA